MAADTTPISPDLADEIRDIAQEVRDLPPNAPKEQAKEIADHLKEIARELRDSEGGNASGGQGSGDPYNH